MKYTGIDFKAHGKDDTKVVASVAYQFSGMDGFTDVGPGAASHLLHQSSPKCSP